MDADVLVYSAAFACEHTIYTLATTEWQRDFESRKALNTFLDLNPLPAGSYTITTRKEVEPVENALFNARSMVRTTQEKMEADRLVLYLSGPTNFRLGIAKIKPYKGNRDPDHKPVHGPAVKAMLRREFEVVTSQDQEADDDISIAHYGAWLQDPYSTVIATIDKDLDMVPGLHYNFRQDKSYYIEPLEGMRLFYEQILKGDTTDNIPGIPGIGKAKAAQALAKTETEQEMYEVVRALYVQGYPDNPDEALLENARLLWMRREPNQWWNPPGVNT